LENPPAENPAPISGTSSVAPTSVTLVKRNMIQVRPYGKGNIAYYGQVGNVGGNVALHWTSGCAWSKPTKGMLVGCE
jgi:hypothetical protein